MLCGMGTRWGSQLQRNKETVFEKTSRKVSSVWLVSHGHLREQHGQVLGLNRGGVSRLPHQQQLIGLQQWHCQHVASSLSGLRCTRDLGALRKGTESE